MVETVSTGTATMVRKDEGPIFPFNLEDLKYWVVRRKDGLVVKYTVILPSDVVKEGIIQANAYNKALPTQGTVPSLGAWCKHDPAPDPIWQGKDYDLYIADAAGCRKDKGIFDLVLDCGDILTLPIKQVAQVLEGDDPLIDLLGEHCTQPIYPPTRVLQIGWDDRKAPPVKETFWTALHEGIKGEVGTVLCACQGGHGRSGTSLVCLMMVANPEYTPADAIIHLRAMHCPRAIESEEQHRYINAVGVALGRKGDVERVKGVKDFRAEFLKMTLPSAKPYQERLMKEKK